MRTSGARAARGYTAVWAMASIAVLGLSLSAAGPLWRDAARREREADALRIGRIYAVAIDNYRRASPGTDKRYPPSLEALLEDTRFVGIVRHMRRLYPDPLRPGQPWSVVRGSDGRIRGVASTSSEEPLRREPLDLGIVALPTAHRYSDWQFVPKTEP